MNPYTGYLLATILQSYTKIDTVPLISDAHVIVQTYKSSNDLCASEFAIHGIAPLTEMYVLPDEIPVQGSVFQGDISQEETDREAKFVGSDSYWHQGAIRGKYSYPAITILDKTRLFTLKVIQYFSPSDKGSISEVRIQCDVDHCKCKQIPI